MVLSPETPVFADTLSKPVFVTTQEEQARADREDGGCRGCCHSSCNVYKKLECLSTRSPGHSALHDIFS